MKKLSIFASIAIIANLGLAGCGSSSSTPSGTEATASDILVQGTAIDPELVNATVCLDVNGDENCTSADPSTTTDKNGHYALTLTKAQVESDAPLLVVGGEDKATGEVFKGKLLADLNSTSQNITPLTTLSYMELKEDVQGTSTAKLETLLGLSYEEMQSNIVAIANEGETKALQTALTLQKSAEALMPEDTLKFYTALAEKIESADTTQTLEGLILELTPDDIKTDMVSFIETLMTTSLEDAYAIAEEAKDEALSRGLDFESRIIETQREHTPADMEEPNPENPAETIPFIPHSEDDNASTATEESNTSVAPESDDSNATSVETSTEESTPSTSTPTVF